jgi:ATP-dependent Lon protease
MLTTMTGESLDWLMFNELLDKSGQPAGETDEGAVQKSGDAPLLLPILPLRGMVVYPLAALPLRAAQPRAVRLIDDAILRKSSVGMVASKSPHKDDPGVEDIYTVGTIATIARQFKSAVLLGYPIVARQLKL